MQKISIKIVLLLLTGSLFTCQDDADILHQTRTQRLSREASRAQKWYKSFLPGEVLTIDRGTADSPIEAKPNWEQVETSSDQNQRIVEIGLYMKGALFMTMEENKQKFEKTGDERYAYSYTRLVIRTKLKSGNTDAFLMTVVPSVEYIELTNFNPFEKVKYIERDKRFSGRIIYHDLNGEFVHGWVYEDGKVARSIRPADQEEDPVVMMRSSGTSNCNFVEEWGWTQTCTDWFQYNEYGVHVYLGTTCTPRMWTLIRTYMVCGPGDGDDGGWDDGGWNGEEDGGGGGGGGYYPPTVSFQELEAISNLILLSETQKVKLKNALEDVINESCLQMKMYNLLKDKKIKLTFGLEYNPNDSTAPANYYSNSKSIRFKDENTIDGDNLKEELFHALQDAYYAGGISQYGKDSQGNNLPGHVNIEFEAKVFKDISSGMGCCYIFRTGNVPIEIRNAYADWIYSIQDNPALLNGDYDCWLDLFNQYHPEYSSPKHGNLSLPSSLNELINMSNCF